MIITRVCDYMHCWRLVNESPCLKDVRNALADVRVEDFLSSRTRLREVSIAFKGFLKARDWGVDIRPPNGGPSAVIDAVREKIGVEFFAAVNTAVPHRSIFANIPALKYAGLIDLALVLVPEDRFHAKGSRATYGNTVKTLREIAPLRLPMPLAILGYANKPKQITLEYLTTELDYYLQNRIGLSLNEIAYKGERNQIEFKRELPDDNKSIAREFCALANETGGGTMLVGVANDGSIYGVNDVDSVEQRVQSIARDRCAGTIALNCLPIVFADDASMTVLAVEVKVINGRPAMTDERVPIRVGTTVRNARADEIQRMVIADLASIGTSPNS